MKIICNYIDNTLSIFSDCFNYNVDSAGHDLETKVGISSIHACQELCKSNSDCNYFLFGYKAAEGTCWLKTEKVATFTSYEGLVFGPKTCGMNIFFCKCRLIMFNTATPVAVIYFPNIYLLQYNEKSWTSVI